MMVLFNIYYYYFSLIKYLGLLFVYFMTIRNQGNFVKYDRTKAFVTNIYEFITNSIRLISGQQYD